MFTGLVEEIGTITRMQQIGQGYSLSVQAKKVCVGTQLGDSIAVNGVCLTVTHLTHNGFTVDLSPETRSRTNLAMIAPGTAVHLERALTPTSRLGGHFVQGHIDGVGTITALRPDGDAFWLTITTDSAIMRYIVPKGFVALDGVSLTVVDVGASSFTVTLIAYTQTQITLARHPLGYAVNIEGDILGKYIEKQLATQFGSAPTKDISITFLAQHGYA